MKVLLALALSFVCFNALAKSVSTVDRLTSYLPVGFYEGRNDRGEFCSVIVSEVNYPKRDIQVRVMNPKADLTKLVEENSEAGGRAHLREFIQTETNILGSDDSQYVERVIRTVTAGASKQYVVVSYSIVNNRERQTEVADCVVDLP